MKQDAIRPNNTPENKPLLIYDGDCGFCKYWAFYWKKLTDNKVNYQPYQEVASNYPHIPIEAFQKAVQYIAPNGTVSSAAKASFLTLSHAKGKAFWLWLYTYLPGFAFFSEKAYALIAKHRPFFFTISLLLWGREHEPPRYNLISWLFLRGLGLVFLAAFVSFGMQALGLVGHQGIIPVSELVEAGKNQLGTERYWFLPMVFWLNSSDLMIQMVCWCGIILSVLLICNKWPRSCLLLLFALYLSLVTAGQMFMAFQWDLYLLETSILAIILLTRLNLGIWLLRWLLFRFMLAGGLVKLFSGDPTWKDYSALNYYFFTEPLPTPLAWYANQLPSSLLTAATALTLVIEVVVPFFFFFPRRLRFFAGWMTLIFQSIILLTGNYNFFNILTMLLCLTLFDDAAIRSIMPQKVFERFGNVISTPRACYKITSLFISLFAILTISISLVQFQLRFRGPAPVALTWLNNTLSPLRLVNTYGPFAVITTQRMEIIIEGSDDGVTWREYAFKYKPGDVKRRPLWNIPFQPRLDWQLWFAALGEPENNPWFYRLMQRILENSPAVMALLETNPFPDKPPVYLRALFYDYRFTDDDERETTGAWWRRELIRLYLPQVQLKIE